MPVVLMNRPSALPRSTTLVSPVTRGTPASRRPRAIARRCGRARREASPPPARTPARQIARLGAHHGQVVHRAVHRQRADVAAGELERAAPRRCRWRSRSRLRQRQDRGVVASWSRTGLPKCGQEPFAQQRRAQLAARAVAQLHPVSSRRAGSRDTPGRSTRESRSCGQHARPLAGTGRSCSRPRTRLPTTPSARPAAARACSASRRRGTGAA